MTLERWQFWYIYCCKILNFTSFKFKLNNMIVSNKLSKRKTACREILCLYDNGRRSHTRCSVKKHVLKNFANFSGKHLCWSLSLIHLKASRPTTLLKKDSNTGVFLLNFQNFYENLVWRTSANYCSSNGNEGSRMPAVTTKVYKLKCKHTVNVSGLKDVRKTFIILKIRLLCHLFQQ